jgi:hypothetical protein
MLQSNMDRVRGFFKPVNRLDRAAGPPRVPPEAVSGRFAPDSRLY